MLKARIHFTACTIEHNDAAPSLSFFFTRAHPHFSLSRLSFFLLPFLCISTRGGRRRAGSRYSGYLTACFFLSFLLFFSFCIFICVHEDPVGSVPRLFVPFVRFLLSFYLLFLFYKNHSTAPAFISFKTHPFVRWMPH